MGNSNAFRFLIADLWAASLPHAPEADVVLSCEVRLSRNIRDRLFPSTQTAAMAREVLAQAEISLAAVAAPSQDLFHLTPGDRHLVLEAARERNLLADAFADHSHIYLSSHFTKSVAVNQEDHFAFTGRAAGLDLRMAEHQALAWERALEKDFVFAAAVDLGYLTTKLAGAGPGIHGRVLVHFPALARLHGPALQTTLKQRPELSRWSVEHLSIGDVAVAELFWIGGRGRLGEQEEEFLESLETALYPSILEERALREAEREADASAYDDAVWRAWGLYNNHRKITMEEAVQLWSVVRTAAAIEVLDADFQTMSGVPFRTGAAYCRLFVDQERGQDQTQDAPEKGSSNDDDLTILDEARSRILRRDFSGGL